MTNELLAQLVPVLGSLLAAALTWAAVQGARLIGAKVKNAYLAGTLARALDAVSTSVKEVSQVYVDALKDANKDGVLSPEERAQAKALAVAKAKEHLGPHGLAELMKVLGLDATTVDGWLGAKVESVVHDINKGISTPR